MSFNFNVRIVMVHVYKCSLLHTQQVAWTYDTHTLKLNEIFAARNNKVASRIDTCMSVKLTGTECLLAARQRA